jgi:hypothetical protein
MPNEKKRWLAKIWIGDKVDQPVVVYGESIAKLREAAGKWLEENKPPTFSNASPQDKVQGRRVRYYYQDVVKEPRSPFEEPRGKGWYRISAGPYSTEEGPNDFENVVSHFVERSVVPEKGPNYEEVMVVDGEFQLHLVKTIRREKEETNVHDLLQRGWCLIGIEYEGFVDGNEILISRETKFVLGHPEENAS